MSSTNKKEETQSVSVPVLNFVSVFGGFQLMAMAIAEAIPINALRQSSDREQIVLASFSSFTLWRQRHEARPLISTLND